MTPNTEQIFLSDLYERLRQSITFPYNAAWEEVVDSTVTFVHLSKGTVLNPADFVNLVTPKNPNGDLGATELFSRMVDVVPEIKADYIPSSDRVSTVYRHLIENIIDFDVPSEQNLEKTYNKAYAFLHNVITVQDHLGQDVKLPIPSAIVETYENNKLAYRQAVSNYQSAYLNYDLTHLQQQRDWLANAPLLELAVSQAYNRWRRDGAAQVEQARSTLKTTKNSKSKSAISLTLQNLLKDALEIMTASAFASRSDNEKLWYLSYALPTDWIADSDNTNFSYLELSTSLLKEGESSRFRNFSGDQSWLDGLWSVEDASADNNGSVHHHLEAEEISLSAKIGIVQFYRPWFDPLILKIAKQFADAVDLESFAHSLLIPAAFITARDIQLKGDFTEKDRQHLEQSFNSSMNISFGPIRLSGRFSHSQSAQTFNSTEDNGTIMVPGLHILAWVSEIVPPSNVVSAYGLS